MAIEHQYRSREFRGDLRKSCSDIAANADWNASPYLLVVDGKSQPNGGTSAATPLIRIPSSPSSMRIAARATGWDMSPRICINRRRAPLEWERRAALMLAS